jgi:hypothetical protein
VTHTGSKVDVYHIYVLVTGLDILHIHFFGAINNYYNIRKTNWYAVHRIMAYKLSQTILVTGRRGL